MPLAGILLGACSASKEARRDVNDKSPVINSGEKVGKRSETSAICTNSAVVHQLAGIVPADRRQLVNTSDRLCDFSFISCKSMFDHLLSGHTSAS